MNLFGDAPDSDLKVAASKAEVPLNAPLAARLRPRSFAEFVGQAHLVGPSAPLRRAVEADRVPSCLFYGPAGTGKTTLARLIAGLTRSHFEDFSAVTGNVAQVRQIIEAARLRNKTSKRTILFVDEIHRFNRAQQDAFLPCVEEGVLTLLGATTENPLASLNTPLLSRCRLFAFEKLSKADILALLQRTFQDERGLPGMSYQIAALEHIADYAGGDARVALGALEMTADLAGPGGTVSLGDAETVLVRRAHVYDRSGDNHYDIISAYIKSLRGSDPDAALYWLARMLDGGEDPMFIARRLAIQASEDVGNADPQALILAMATLEAVARIGLPEAAIPLAQTTIYVAVAPKSNASYIALQRAREAVAQQEAAPVPAHLRSTALRGSKEKTGAGEGYLYPHDFPGHHVQQDYLPPGFKSHVYYEPTEQGAEAGIAARLRQLHEGDVLSGQQGKAPDKI